MKVKISEGNENGILAGLIRTLHVHVQKRENYSKTTIEILSVELR